MKFDNRRDGGRPKRMSPLYTPKETARAKHGQLESLGKDADGASRVTNRKDGKEACQ